MAMHPHRLTAAESDVALAHVRRLFDPNQVGMSAATENYSALHAIFPWCPSGKTRLMDGAIAGAVSPLLPVD